MHFRLVLPSPRLMLCRVLRLPVISQTSKALKEKKCNWGKIDRLPEYLPWKDQSEEQLARGMQTDCKGKHDWGEFPWEKWRSALLVKEDEGTAVTLMSPLISFC